MRGASLLLLKSGARVEPDKERGVRVSRMGIGKAIEKNCLKYFLISSFPRKRESRHHPIERMVLMDSGSSPE